MNLGDSSSRGCTYVMAGEDGKETRGRGIEQ